LATPITQKPEAYFIDKDGNKMSLEEIMNGLKLDSIKAEEDKE